VSCIYYGRDYDSAVARDRNPETDTTADGTEVGDD